MIIDTHIHLGYVNQFYFYDVSISRFLKKMDTLNITYCINAHSESLIHGHIEKGIEESISAYDESEGRILNYFIYNPNQASLCLKMMEKNMRQKAFKGIKIHPSMHNTYADDLSYESVWQYAADQSLPIMSHTWALSSYNDSQKYSYPTRFEQYISKYPQVSFICGHSGGRYDGIKKAVGLAQSYPNVYLDTAGDVYDYKLIEYMMGKAGAHKIIFGSDALWFEPATQMGMILGACISMEDKEKILYKNARQVFGIEKN